MTPQDFAKKWKASTLKESSASQEHFLDLCRLLDEQTPAEADPDGSWYCFERGAKKTGGGDGWADVWRRGYFAWEYKGKHKNLTAAFAQLQRYAIALENPPLLVVCDMDTILIHTSFTNTVQEVHAIPLEEIGLAENLRKLKWLFTEPEKLRPGQTTAAITEEAARKFASLAEVLRGRGCEPQRVAHFLNRLLFCLFAEDARLLPPQLVVRLLEAGLKHPEQANNMLRALFAAMTKGGLFGADMIEWFNGGLFDSDDAIPLEPNDIKEILSVARLDWSSIEPSVFGTLFERGLDPSKRAQLGAHYTDALSIMRIVQPVVIDPLEVEWRTAKVQIESALAKVIKLPTYKRTSRKLRTKPKAQREAEAIYASFMHRLAEFRVLDPACGSGNFLYLALQALKDLELRVMLEAEQLGLHAGFVGMNVGVQCVQGIELNTYAAELARVTVWIGEIQWMLRHGVPPSKNPILKPLDAIECRDAILNKDATEAIWPKADAIVGNPPFLGGSKMLGELGKNYCEDLRARYDGRVPGGADLVTYWFEKSRAQIEERKAAVAGLVATNSIRGGASRAVLDRIVETGQIFNAWSDEEWINEGAAVRVSLVCFSGGSKSTCMLDGIPVPTIQPDLTSGADAALINAVRQHENEGAWAYGSQEKGDFSVAAATARHLLRQPNPHGKPNSDVLKRAVNAKQIVQRRTDDWVVDFGLDMPLDRASLYEGPFAIVKEQVAPRRLGGRDRSQAKRWWLHARPSPKYREARARLPRLIATPCVSSHRIFFFLYPHELADHALVVIARADDATFGVLQSRFHEIWSLRLCTWLGAGNDPRYTPTTCFETFPFPKGLTPIDTAKGLPKTALTEAIADTARRLDRLREEWLNPPEWTRREPEVVSTFPDRLVPKAGHEADLKKRTLTNLYNERPTWLVNAHLELDLAIARAYGWTDYTAAMPDEKVLSRLLALNLERSGAAAPEMTTTFRHA